MWWTYSIKIFWSDYSKLPEFRMVLPTCYFQLSFTFVGWFKRKVWVPSGNGTRRAEHASKPSKNISDGSDFSQPFSLSLLFPWKSLFKIRAINSYDGRLWRQSPRGTLRAPKFFSYIGDWCRDLHYLTTLIQHPILILKRVKTLFHSNHVDPQ